MGILDDAIREHLELKRKHGVPEDEVQRQEEEALGPARREVAQQHEEAEPAAGQTATAEAEPDDPSDDGQSARGGDGAVRHGGQWRAAGLRTGAGPASRGDGAGGGRASTRPSLPEAPRPPLVEARANRRWSRRPSSRRRSSRRPSSRRPSSPAHGAHRRGTAADPIPQEPPPVEPTPEEPTPEEEPVSDDELGDTEPHGFPAVGDDEPLCDEDEDVLAEDEDLDVLEDTPDFLQETPEHDRLWFEQKPPRDFDFD